MELKKGDVVLVQAPDSASGTEIRKTRPAVVISPGEMAKHGKRVLVVPVTSNISKVYPKESKNLFGKICSDVSSLGLLLQ